MMGLKSSPDSHPANRTVPIEVGAGLNPASELTAAGGLQTWSPR